MLYNQHEIIIICSNMYHVTTCNNYNIQQYISYHQHTTIIICNDMYNHQYVYINNVITTICNNI